MDNSLFQNEELNYNALFGKLFSVLLNQFGAKYDNTTPDNKEN